MNMNNENNSISSLNNNNNNNNIISNPMNNNSSSTSTQQIGINNLSTNNNLSNNSTTINTNTNNNINNNNNNNNNNNGRGGKNNNSNGSGLGSESYYRNQAEKLDKENKQLKSKMDTIERENRELKKSLYELSFRFDHLASQSSKPPKPFSLDHLESSSIQPSSNSSLSSSFVNLDPSSIQLSTYGESSSSNNNNQIMNNSSNLNSMNNTTSSNPSQEIGATTSSSSTMNNVNNSSAQATLSSGSNVRNVQHSSGSIRKISDGKHFYCKQTLKGHSGAIYSVAFAPCGKFLASGSFDKTARVWDASTGQENICFQDHQLSVCDLSWSYDSTLLLTGSFDHTSKIWSLETSKLLSSHEVSGFAQSVVFDSQDHNIFFVGCTHKKVYLFDRRQTENSMTFENDAMMTGLYIYRDGLYILSSDSNGCLKLWDKRKSTPLSFISVSSDDKKVPISNIHVSKAVRTDEEGKYLGVNCYDNVLRVYDRGANSSSIATQPSVNRLELTHSVLGYKNKNWPITSSFFVGKNYQLFGSHNRSGSDNDEEGNEESSEDEKHSENSFLLATGSADPFAYIFNISSQKGNYSMVQKLEGHTDRVYGVHFHPFDPILASCSSDSTVKLWTS